MRFFLIALLLTAVPAMANEPVTPMSSAQYSETVQQFDYGAHTVDLAKFQALAAQPGTIILDLRERLIYDGGHYAKAQWLGADITAQKLAALVPDKSAPILVYCDNSLHQSRRISLTDLALPQIAALGYENVHALERVWGDDGETSPEILAAFSGEKLGDATRFANNRVFVTRFAELAGQPKTSVLDLRPRADYDAGHYKGALWLGPDLSYDKIAALVPDKSSTLLFYDGGSLTREGVVVWQGPTYASIMGYANAYTLAPLWPPVNNVSDADKALFTAETN